MPVLGTRILPPRIHTTHMGPGPESVPRPRNSQTMNSCMYVYEPTCMEWREGGVRWSMEMGPLPPSLHCTLLPLFSHGTLSSSNRVIDSPLTHWIRARTSRAFSDMQASCFLPQIQGTCPVSQIICHSMANQGNVVRHLHTL